MARILKTSRLLPTGEMVVIEEEAGYLYVALQSPKGDRTRIPEQCSVTLWQAESLLWEEYYKRGGQPPALK